MKALRIEHASEFPVPSSELWSFHLRPEALAVLAPPLSGFAVVDRGAGVADGSMLVAEVGWPPFRRRWQALHLGVEPGRSFTDVALESPFPYWVHHHAVEPAGAGASRLIDTVWFVPPRWLPSRLGGALTAAALRLFFAWRHRATRRWLSGRRPAGRTATRLCGFFAPGGCS
jgi:ligand-binding SRPBCC domain-containing protein